jgi:hypothetical protein
MKIDVEFLDLLKNLGSLDQRTLLRRLSAFSDLDRPRLQRLTDQWRQLPTQRRRQIIRLMGELADEHIELTFEVINRMAMADSDPQVRATAIANLWECEDPSLVPSLLDALRQDPDARVRAAAAKSLGGFVYIGETADLPGESLPQIEQALLEAHDRDQAIEVRIQCLESLGFSSRPEVQHLIRAAYERQEPNWLRAAFVAMGRSADPQWADVLMFEIHNPDPQLRLAAVEAAGELELRKLVPGLVDLLEDAYPPVRRAAIWSLGQIGGAIAEDMLTALLESSEDPEEIQLLEDALDNLAFVNGTRDLLLLNFDEDEDDID